MLSKQKQHTVAVECLKNTIPKLEEVLKTTEPESNEVPIEKGQKD